MVTGNRGGKEVLEALGEMSELVLRARYEEDFLERLAFVLREYVQCDAVILRLLERHIHTRAVATQDGVRLLPPDELWEPLSRTDREFWLENSDGIHCEDIETNEYIKSKPKFREHALQLGLKSGFMVPGVRDGEIHGLVTFAWTTHVTLQDSQKKLLRELSDFACLQFTLFNIRRSHEFDPMTGLLNRLGLKRRWEAPATTTRGILLLIEVGGLKSVAGARGQLAVDDMVRQIGRMLLHKSGPQVAIGRYSDTHFVLLAPHMPGSRAEQLRRTIADGFDELVATLPPPHPRCTISSAQWPQDGRDFLRVVERAEQRLHERQRRRIELTMSTEGTLQQGRLPRTFMDGWLATSPDGVIVTDQDARVIYVNDAYQSMTGYSLSQWVGKTPGFVASNKTPPDVYQDMWSKLGTDGAWVGKLINRHRSGKEWISHLSITKIDDRRGRPVGFLGIARDATDGVYGDDGKVPAAFDPLLTQDALAFALATAAQMHRGSSSADLARIRDLTRLLVTAAAERGHPDLQSYEYRSAIILGSILHDVGILFVPQSILRKPDRLSDAEFEHIKTHPEIGRRLLQSSGWHGSSPWKSSLFLTTASNIAGSHHERWDGSGYPRGLAGEDIPLEARLVAIVDVYDALRSWRPYKCAWSHAAAVAYIVKKAGTHFDPVLVEVFASLQQSFQDVFEQVHVPPDEGGRVG